MKQVLINLLSNAIKYNKVGGTVVVDCITSTPGRIRICVKDTGDGLTPDKLAQLFQPFNRLGKEASVEEGTGIGLVVTKRLVELMGGSHRRGKHGRQGQRVLDRAEPDGRAATCRGAGRTRGTSARRKFKPTRSCAPCSTSRTTRPT